MNKKINVLSLFDGMSCGQIALKNLGIICENYFASEIDNSAIKVTKDNFPKTKHIGDINKIDLEKLPKIDLLFGGSPCQGFSFAGKQLNFKDSRSKLFFKFVEVLEFLKEKNNELKFLLENVPMKKEYENEISRILNVKAICINSNLVSAQDRKRLYWTNINFEKPKDRGILLKDVVGFESNIPKINETIEEIKKFTKREFQVSISKNGRIRPHRFDAKKSGISEIGTIANPNDKCVTIIASHAPKTYKSNPFEIHELTRNECEMIQNVPVNYTKSVSEKQAKKMLGNGWTVGIIESIFSYL